MVALKVRRLYTFEAHTRAWCRRSRPPIWAILKFLIWCCMASELSSTPIHEEGLRHQLSAGQMAMVAVGGSIGTGLLLGSGAAMEVAGPAAILSFIAAAFINWTVAMALGELACAHPAAGSFGVYGDLYLNDFAGFIARSGYPIGLALAI